MQTGIIAIGGTSSTYGDYAPKSSNFHCLQFVLFNYLKKSYLALNNDDLKTIPANSYTVTGDLIKLPCMRMDGP